jgi:hypothetical protein
VKGRLDLAVTDLGPTVLKNIAEPVRAYSLQVGISAAARLATQARPPEPKKRSMARLVAGIGALVVAVGGAWYSSPEAALRPPRTFRLLCCPSQISRATPQDCGADGVTENLTTDLLVLANTSPHFARAKLSLTFCQS